MHPLYIVAEIQYYTGKNVKYEREAYGQERGINKKQPDLINGNIKLSTQVGTHTKRVSLKKSKYPL
jgi:hypothetical protein